MMEVANEFVLESSEAKKPKKWLFPTIVTITVMFFSFAYGLAKGLRPNMTNAYAGMTAPQDWTPMEEDMPEFVSLPHGVRFSSLGKEMTLNSKPASIFSFVTNSSIQALLKKQSDAWEKMGFQVAGVAKKESGVVVALDPKTKKRYSASAWMIPAPMRAQVSQGYSVQGTVGMLDSEADSGSDGGTLPGEIPGIPIKSGGKGSAVVSSVDLGVRTYSGAYTVPGSVLEVVEYYQQQLGSQGWRKSQSGESAESSPGDALFLKRGREELTLLFTPVSSGLSFEKKSLVTILLSLGESGA